MEVTRAAGGIFELASKIAHIHLQRPSYSGRCRAVIVRGICHGLLGRHRHCFSANDGGWCMGQGLRKALEPELEQPPYRWCRCIDPRKHCADVLDVVVFCSHLEQALLNCTTAATFANRAQTISYLFSKCMFYIPPP